MSNVLSGKASRNELEDLHGKVAKVYGRTMDNLLEAMADSDVAQEQYKISVAQDKMDGGDGSDVHKPYKFVLDKDALALLKGAQGFLKENDVQMDISKGSDGKTMRSNIAKQLKKKREELE